VTWHQKQAALRAACRRLDARERAERTRLERIAAVMPPVEPAPPMFRKTSAEELAANAARWTEARRCNHWTGD
jgi:hypothetical protein